MTTIILLGILGAVITAVVGTLWYSDTTPMGKLQLRALGFDRLTPDERAARIAAAKPRMVKQYFGQFALAFLTACAASFIVIMSMQNGVPFSMALCFVVVNWLCFMVPIIGQNILWGNVDRSLAWKKFFSEISSNLVTLLIIAYIAHFFA